MATYAIGDIHGTIGALKTIFAEVPFEPEDTLVFLGDYVNKGPDTKGVIDFLIARQKEYRTIFLMGNHEISMMEARWTKEKLEYWLQGGGEATFSSYGGTSHENWADLIPKEHWDFLENTTRYWVQGNDIFVHAGLKSGVPLLQQHRVDLFWKRGDQPQPYSPGKRVICGHTSRINGEIADFGHTICIDTYAWGGQWLTCLNVDTLDFLQAREDGQFRTGKLKRDQ